MRHRSSAGNRTRLTGFLGAVTLVVIGVVVTMAPGGATEDEQEDCDGDEFAISFLHV